jgi:hypothetical protein
MEFQDAEQYVMTLDLHTLALNARMQEEVRFIASAQTLSILTKKSTTRSAKNST